MNPRIRMLLCAVFLASIFPRCAVAQFGVYGEFNGAIDVSGFNFPTNMYGATVGSYFDLFRVGPFVPGLDARGTFLQGSACCSNNFHINSFLIGPRLTFRLSKGRVKPYGEFLVGLASAGKSNSDSLSQLELAYQPTGGVDVALLRLLDWRLIEVSYEVGTGAPFISNTQTGILSTGLAFHF
ncbi:MAG TPA: hypothetical protein VE195_05230 [Acidobacteriaceae bacterium]|nr:hypothetical protein [Acidobacteriaceae bacterium]